MCLWSNKGKRRHKNQETTKLMNCIVDELSAISDAPSGGSNKTTIKARLSNSFVRKETKTKWVQPWLHQIEAYMAT
jgi:hypothetical protein